MLAASCIALMPLYTLEIHCQVHCHAPAIVGIFEICIHDVQLNYRRAGLESELFVADLFVDNVSSATLLRFGLHLDTTHAEMMTTGNHACA
jgi:hypothetical protein